MSPHLEEMFSRRDVELPSGTFVVLCWEFEFVQPRSSELVERTRRNVKCFPFLSCMHTWLHNGGNRLGGPDPGQHAVS